MLTKNAIECARCHDVIESKYRHDFKTCGCGTVSVDGGLDYLKRLYMEVGDVIERSEFDGTVAE